MRLSELLAGLDRLIPFRYAEPWDKVGLAIGDANRTVARVLVALDLTDASLESAREMGADLMICHHPPIFSPLPGLRVDQPIERLPVLALQAGLAVASLHTNLDAAAGGVADQFAQLIGLEDVQTFLPLSDAGNSPSGPWPMRYAVVPGFGRSGSLPQPLPLVELVMRLRRQLGSPQVMVAAAHSRPVRRVTVCPGSYDGSWTPLLVGQGSEALVVGEIKYHDRLLATAAGVTVIEVGHDVSERVVLSPLADLLAGVWPELAFAVDLGFDYNEMAF